MRSDDRQELTRREAIGAGLAAAAGALALGRGLRAAPSPSPYGPFKMGLQSYSLRGLTTDGKADVHKALHATKDLGVTYWEAYPAHFPVVGLNECGQWFDGLLAQRIGGHEHWVDRRQTRGGRGARLRC